MSTDPYQLTMDDKTIKIYNGNSTTFSSLNDDAKKNTFAQHQDSQQIHPNSVVESAAPLADAVVPRSQRRTESVVPLAESK